MATLLAIRGPLTGTRLTLGDETRFGRAESMDVVLPDAGCSREHARIRRRNLAYMVEDLGSRHGTWLNRQRLDRPRPLLKNDELMIGESLFLFDSDLDVQNADYSDCSVVLALPTDETMEVSPVAVLETIEREGPGGTGDEGLDFVTRLGELFDTSDVPFGDALSRTAERLLQLFAADVALVMLWDSAARRLRPSVVLTRDNGNDSQAVIADREAIERAHQDGKPLLMNRSSEAFSHPSLGESDRPGRSLMALPLGSADRGRGVLYLERRDGQSFTLIELRQARAVARLLGVFIESRQTAEALQLRLRYATQDTALIGESRAMKDVLEVAAKVAPSRATILIQGETGTGKEVVAREIHRLSEAGKSGGAFVAINCSAVPEDLFESLLFGHEKGAFTGAVRTQRGYVEEANGGTLFLDEIGELSPRLQPKLLRFLQEHTFQRIGSGRLLRADVRLLCATNRDLKREVAEGRFREDLYHRISVLPIELPPLRDRPEDIPLLAEHFIAYHARAMGRALPRLAAETSAALLAHGWPGNVRELSNCLERAVLLCEAGVLLPDHIRLVPLPARRPSPAPEAPASPPAGDRFGPQTPLSEIESAHIARVLAHCRGNQVRASEILGIHRNTLRKKIQEYDLK
ncbi:MAG: sigma 54-interacting transcriptional regulator [Sumerlaeia bacterium]